MPEDRPTISSSRVNASGVVRRTFATVRRGFDPQEVRSYLDLVARELQGWEQREREMQSDLADALERARHPVIDEATLTAALGQQTALILRSAHEEAARITSRAEDAAAATTREAQQHVGDSQIQAESSAAERIAAAELAAAAITQEARDAATSALEVARAEGERIVAEARDQGRAMLEQAQEASKRVLAEAAARRQAVHSQIEQLRAARDELAATVTGVRGAVDHILDGLAAADDEARAAAAAVVRAPWPSETQPSPGAEPGGDEVGGAPGDRVVESAAGPEAPVVPARSEAGGGTEGATRTDEDQATVGTEGGVGSEGEPEATTRTDAPPHPGGGEPSGDAEGRPLVGRETDEGPPEGGPEGGVGGEGMAATVDRDGPGEPHPHSTLDELFARIRAGGSASAATTPAGPGAGLTTGDLPTVPVHTGAAEGRESPEPLEQGISERGESLIEPLARSLARRLKRAFADDQNRILDRVRVMAGSPMDELLGEEDGQAGRYLAAVADQLTEAYEAGTSFAGELEPAVAGRPPRSDAGSGVVEPIAAELAATAVSLLRNRLLGPEDDAPPEDAAARVGAAFREWRGDRLDRLAGDAVRSAFCQGVLDRCTGEVRVAWVLPAQGAACPDCEDDSLSDPVEPGVQFPTGHCRPPAHPGCHCLVAPTTA